MVAMDPILALAVAPSILNPLLVQEIGETHLLIDLGIQFFCGFLEMSNAELPSTGL